jgi:hypothetical protein
MKTVFFITQSCLPIVFSLLFLHYTTLFIVFGVINAPVILYNQYNSSYPNYIVTLII